MPPLLMEANARHSQSETEGEEAMMWEEGYAGCL
jgi:hypothetical protein